MSLTIYTTGSAEFLEIMLNSSAMITGSGTTEDLARVGIIIGLILLAFQAVMNNEGISFHKAGVVLVLYLIFYGPTTTAVIEDTTAGQVRVVDNVPFGPTAVGWVISTLAYEITKLSEQAYSTPTMTEYGLFSSLNTIAKVRDALRDPMALDSFSNRPNWDLPRSLQEYMTFCLLNPIALRNYTSIPELYRKSSYVELMQSPLQSQYMYVYNPNPQLVSCSQGHALLMPQLNQAFADVFDDILNKGFAPERASGKMSSPYQVQAALNDSIQSMAISAKNAQEYVQTATIMPIFNNARVDALNHWQEKNSALALRQAINQQELQWAAKGDMFKHYMRPMIAFFEGMLYAMTPFMAFALLLGGPGLKIMGKYLILPIAVGLWMPLLSVVNAFTLWYAGAEVGAVLERFDATGQGFAMLQVLEMDQAISKALGIGGLLAASVPPLALFIVSGSAMVANGIMSQTSQASTFKPQDIMPDVKKQAAVLETSSSYTSDQLTQGAHVTGAPQVAETISSQQAASALVQSAKVNANTATEAYQRNLSSAVETASTSSYGREQMASLGNQVGASLNLTDNAQYQDAVSTLKGAGYTENQIAAGTFAASVGASVPLGLAGAKLEQSEQFQKLSGKRQEEVRQAMAQLSSSVQAGMNKQSLFDAGEAFKNTASASIGTTSAANLSESLTEARSAQETYQRVSSMEQSFGAGQSLDLKQAAAASLNKGESREDAARKLMEMAGSTTAGRAAMLATYDSESIRNLSTDDNERIAMSAIRALNQDGRLGELVSSEISPFDFNVNTGNAHQNANLQGDAPDTAGLAGEVRAGRSSAIDAYRSEHDMSSSGFSNLRENGALIVGESHNDFVGKVHAQNASNEAQVASTTSVPQVEVNVDSVQPVEDTASGFVQAPISSALNGVGQIAEGATRLAGVDQHPAAQATVNAIKNPFQTAKTGVQQIVDGASDLVDKVRAGPQRPPKID